MTTFFVVCLVGFGLAQFLRFAKNNPGSCIKGASMLKDLFRK